MNIEIYEGCFKKGLLLYYGNIIVNSKVKAGENCKLHGMNCIGNKGFDDACPVIGNGVNVGWGAGVFGNVDIADGCIIGANAVVTKSITESYSVWIGVPARKK